MCHNASVPMCVCVRRRAIYSPTGSLSVREHALSSGERRVEHGQILAVRENNHVHGNVGHLGYTAAVCGAHKQLVHRRICKWKRMIIMMMVGFRRRNKKVYGVNVERGRDSDGGSLR